MITAFRFLVVLFAFIFALGVAAEPHSAEEKNKTIVVIGDSLGDGLYTGLRIQLAGKSNVTLKKWARVNTGIARSDRYNWMDAADKIAAQGDVDVVIAMFGANDLQTIREHGHAYHYPTPEWKEHYIARIDRIITTLKNAGIAVEWVGLPITRPNRYQKDYAFLNGIFKERTATNDISYFDTWSVTVDENGEYSAFGADINNNKEQIRDSDGVHFTGAGYVVLADKVIREMGL